MNYSCLREGVALALAKGIKQDALDGTSFAGNTPVTLCCKDVRELLDTIDKMRAGLVEAATHIEDNHGTVEHAEVAAKLRWVATF